MNKKIFLLFLLSIAVGSYLGTQFFRFSSPGVNDSSFHDLHDRQKVRISISSANDADQNTNIHSDEQKEVTGKENLEILENKYKKIFEVEVVNSPQSTAQGLSGRDEIGADGMLFVFPTVETRFFWMKDMKFNLDLIWIANGKVTSVSKNVPKPLPETPDYRLETYSSEEGADMVLELNSGESDKYAINSGDTVQLVQ